jgi:hypothetical protein
MDRGSNRCCAAEAGNHSYSPKRVMSAPSVHAKTATTETRGIDMPSEQDFMVKLAVYSFGSFSLTFLILTLGYILLR